MPLGESRSGANPAMEGWRLRLSHRVARGRCEAGPRRDSNSIRSDPRRFLGDESQQRLFQLVDFAIGADHPV